MKPVIILGRFPPPIDGQSIVTRRLADLLEGDCKVLRLNLSAPDTGFARSVARFSIPRVRHYTTAARQVRRSLRAKASAPVLWASISPTLLGHWRDVISIMPCFAPMQPVWAVVHWGNFERVFESPLTARTARSMVTRVAGYVFLDCILADRCGRWIPEEKRIVIPNTIDDDVHCQADEVAAKHARARTRSRLRVLYLSNMTPSKGPMDLLEAAAMLRDQGVAFTVDYVGRWESDENRSEFERRVDSLGLRDVVTYRGGVSDRAEVRRLHLESDVFVLPTYYPTEAQPLSIIEALNAATPVVSTRHASIPGMMTDGQEGFLVSPRDPSAIAAALRRLSDADAWSRCSIAARQRFERQFDRERVRERWLALLSGVE